MIQRNLQIGIIGPSKINYPANDVLANRLESIAEETGRLIGSAGAILFTGGADGVMEASSRGARYSEGIVVATPGSRRLSSNEYVDVEVLTPINVGDFLFAGILSSDSLIVIGESAGTTAELALGYRHKKPTIIIRGFSDYYDSLINRYMDRKNCVKFLGADSPEKAVRLAIEEAEKYFREG
ncbi:hypothetical protein J4218_03985 [Candidatus Pacearchaeota archaeon]|nr:hypothetical protein [Candidatus Pacearchaeota archaeon]